MGLDLMCFWITPTRVLDTLYLWLYGCNLKEWSKAKITIFLYRWITRLWGLTD